MLPWRNWLARSTVNRKVGGSSPPEDDNFFQFVSAFSFFLHLLPDAVDIFVKALFSHHVFVAQSASAFDC